MQASRRVDAPSGVLQIRGFKPLESVCKFWWSSLASKRYRLDSRLRGKDGDRLYGLFNTPQGGSQTAFKKGSVKFLN